MIAEAVCINLRAYYYNRALVVVVKAELSVAGLAADAVNALLTSSYYLSAQNLLA